MLRRLRIKNFAIIKELDLTFSPGLNVITGETGTGKSIIIGALNLLFGDRYSAEMLRSGEESMFVEGNFEDRTSGEEFIVRREINRSGKNYAFINDKQITLQTLKEMISKFAELMGQHQHQTLLNSANHIRILDEYGGLSDLAGKYKMYLDGYEQLRTKIEQIKISRSERLKKLDFLKYQFSEIETAGLKIGEEEELNRERKILKNASELKELASRINSLLYEGDGSVYEKVGECLKAFEKIISIDENIRIRVDDLENLSILTEEISKAAAEYYEAIDDDPLRLDWVENRLAEINRLKSKYGPDISSIIGYGENIKSEIDLTDNYELRIAELGEELERSVKSLVELGKKLDKNREKVSEDLSKKLKGVLSYLGMDKMRFKTLFGRPDKGTKFSFGGEDYIASENGFSKVEFMISPNPGEELKPLRKIASGGEISRVMLAIKSLFAKKDNIDLLIFDEVDTGIGGETAKKVGILLRELSRSHQLICITHLQQIASMAETHFSVLKKTERKRTITLVKKLNEKERISEIARLISGDSQSESSLKYAEKLLSEAGDN